MTGTVKWVRIHMLEGINGYTREAARAKIKRGVWRDGVHWKQAPDGNIMVSPKAIDDWIDNDGRIPERR